MSQATSLASLTCNSTWPLEFGVEIAQEEILAGPVMFGEVGPIVGQDVQLGVEGLAVVEVISVLAGPAEGLARQDLHSGQVDVSGLQQGDVLLPEVVPDGRRQPNLGEVGGGDTEIGRRPAQRLRHLAEGGLHGVRRRPNRLPQWNPCRVLHQSRYLPTMGSRRRRAASGMAFGSVMMACWRACWQGQSNSAGSRVTAWAINRFAFRLFLFK